MKYILGINFLILLVLLIIVWWFWFSRNEHFQNFQAYFWTNVKAIPLIHTSYSDSSYTRENLIKKQLPSSPNTLYIGISNHNKNTVHKYIINHLLKKILLYHTRQFTLLDIDYPHDYQVLTDLNNNTIQYGLVSTPVLSDYLSKNAATNIQFITTLTHNFIYGITMANREISNIKDIRNATVGISKDIATEWIVAHDIIANMNCQVYKCDSDKLLNALMAGQIDIYFIIDAYPSDRIRWLLNKHRDLRLVDLENSNLEMAKHQYTKVLLNQKLLEYYQKDVFADTSVGRYLPITTPAGTYNDYFPHINSYKFPNCLLTNTGNQVEGHYELIRDIYHKMYNNRRTGLGYLPYNFLQKHIQLGVTNLPVPIHPAIQEFHYRIANNQLDL